MAAGDSRFIHIDETKCLGCRSCEMACGLSRKTLNLFTAVLQGQQIEPRITVVQSSSGLKVVQCRQCEDALCVKRCPAGALYHQNGIVTLDEESCIGCRLCTRVCPYGAIRMTTAAVPASQAKPVKCDLCVNRSGRIDSNAYACVQACPVGALTVVSKQ
jgi:carbon-monoxide dehydrogenase iron sulfur subunit